MRRAGVLGGCCAWANEPHVASRSSGQPQTTWSRGRAGTTAHKGAKVDLVLPTHQAPAVEGFKPSHPMGYPRNLKSSLLLEDIGWQGSQESINDNTSKTPLCTYTYQVGQEYLRGAVRVAESAGSGSDRSGQHPPERNLPRAESRLSCP